MSEAFKGHVPEENLERYRNRRGIAYACDSLAGRMSGVGEYADANAMFALAAKYRALANELRADMPMTTKEP